MITLLYQRPKSYHYLIFFLAAFAVRALTFEFYIKPQERYCQADSRDYHNCAFCISHGYGMHYPHGQPIFWRTPGYPWYLSYFYKQYDAEQTLISVGPNKQTKTDFRSYAVPQQKSIWVQILLSSLLPILILHLALAVTDLLPVAWICASISVWHIGFVLASTYLLTDALAMLLFIGFLIAFYRSIEQKKNALRYAASAALLLAAYTWMRPMGQFVALASVVLFLLTRDNLQDKGKKTALFALLFSAALAPWFMRNQKLTGSFFFCPLFGLYLNVFNAPKILSRVAKIPLKEAHSQLTAAAHQLTQEAQLQARLRGKVACGELVALETALPLIKQHPGYFIYDWSVEVLKTTFDLYSSQLVAFAQNCFRWDPLVEYLDEKIANCLWRGSIFGATRCIAWLEFFGSFVIWIGLLIGTIQVLVAPLLQRRSLRFLFEDTFRQSWFLALNFIGIVLLQTGGFGYARLRLPVEPLILILGVTFWWLRYSKKRLSQDKRLPL